MKGLTLAFISIIFLGLELNTLSAQNFTINSEKFSDQHRQFDFWIGTWDVNLRQRQPDFSWKDWKKSKAQIYSILDGRAILELWEEKGSATPVQTIIGYSLRYFDEEQNKWILWLNWPGVNRSGSSSLSGQFRHGRGEFFSRRQVTDSTSVISRYSFVDISKEKFRWDDAYSRDEGNTWSNNWIMEFTRTEDQAPWPKESQLHTYRQGERCPNPEFQKLLPFVGKWEGTVKRKEHNWKDEKFIMNNYQSLGGCAQMNFLQIGDDPESSYQEFSLLTYNTFAKLFEDGHLSNQENSAYQSYYGKFTDDGQLDLYLRKNNDPPNSGLTWAMGENKELKFTKWTYSNGQKTKIWEGTLVNN